MYLHCERELDSKLHDYLVEKGYFTRKHEGCIEYIPVTYTLIADLDDSNQKHTIGFMCSMFGIWGSRTEDGSLWSARNLDWTKNTGMI